MDLPGIDSAPGSIQDSHPWGERSYSNQSSIPGRRWFRSALDLGDFMLRMKNFVIASLLVVWQLGCGGGSSSQPPSSQGGSPSPNPPANISILPATAIVGSGDLTLTVNGSQTFSFAGGGPRYNKVLWSANGTETELSAIIVSQSELTAIVPATLFTSALQAKVRVEIWDRQEGNRAAMSSSVPFSVTAVPVATPSITSISPETASPGSPDVTITINGSNFGHYGHFIWSTAFGTTNGNLHDTGTWLQTTIISGSQLIAVIPAKLLQSPTAFQIVVMNGDVMGMSDGYFGYPRSNSVTFTVTP